MGCRFAASVCLVGGLVSACYDGGSKADCVGLSCNAGMEWPDGGEASIHYGRYPDGTEWRALTAFFLEHQTPERIDVGPFNRCAPRRPPTVERMFYDVGPSVTFHMGNENVEVDKIFGEDAVDFQGRRFDVAYLAFSNDHVGPDFFNAYHSVTADDGSLPVEISSIYMTPDFDLTNPDLDASRSFVGLKKGQDWVVEWSEQEPGPAEIAIFFQITFYDVSGPADPIVCRGPDSGRFVVPREIVDKLPPNGAVGFATAANEAVLTPDGHRVDTWGFNRRFVPYVMID